MLAQPDGLSLLKTKKDIVTLFDSNPAGYQCSKDKTLRLHQEHQQSYRPHFDLCLTRPNISGDTNLINLPERSLYFSSGSRFYPILIIRNTHHQLRDNLWALSSYHAVFSTDNGMAMYNMKTKELSEFVGGNCKNIMASDGLGTVTVAVGLDDSITLFDNETCKANSSLYTRRAGQSRQQFGCCMLVDSMGSRKQEPKEVWVSGNKLAIWMYDLTGARQKQELYTGLRINKMSTANELISLACDAVDISVFDRRTNRICHTLTGHLDFNMSVSMHPSEPLVASGSQDMTARVWDLRAPAVALGVIPAEFAAVQKVLWTGHGQKLIMAEEMDIIHEIDCTNSTRARAVMPGGLVGLGLDPSGDRLIWGLERLFNNLPNAGIVAFDRNKFF